ncbi:MAG: hypothetical protein ACYC6N_24275, partial [Pirellulaceae bacterium]
MPVATLAQSVGESPYVSYFPRGLRDRGYGDRGYAPAATLAQSVGESPYVLRFCPRSTRPRLRRPRLRARSYARAERGGIAIRSPLLPAVYATAVYAT